VDFATIVGIVAGFALIIMAVVGGGSGGAEFLHVPSLMIVVGGMIASTLIHFSLGQVLRIGSITKKTLFYKLPGEQDLIQKMVNYSAINRRDGALVLEQQIPQAGDAFLVKGLQMVIDGQKEQEVDDQKQEQSSQPECQRRPTLLQKPDGLGQGVTAKGSQDCYPFGDDEHG